MSNTVTNYWNSLAFCVTLFFVCGCGGVSNSKVPKLVPATGTVKLDGQPLGNASVRFIPQPSPGKPGVAYVEESAAVTNSDGSFVLKGIHAEAGRGAMVGEHRVVIEKLVMKKDGSDAPQEFDLATMGDDVKQLLPPIYSDQEKTTLTATVSPEGNAIEFDLKSQP